MVGYRIPWGDAMFELAIVGPVATRGLGVVQQCIACRRAAGPDAASCSGFGAGCLVAGRDAKDATPAQPLGSRP